ncbi:MAG: ABC transporter permease [Lamprobacter sp.]|uniref:MlaE family ABC transporter permease n=1 Tax=Lamprobacter sp. TaxID=3100796 RepID=UPI002B25E1BF|nr:ABC transporter permease [Lamprobacter sp.]MEA3639037.1 ABC transporter permease [Lamprobacter sp.]
MIDPVPPPPTAHVERVEGRIRLRLAGRWRLDQAIPQVSEIAVLIDRASTEGNDGNKSANTASQAPELQFETSALSDWDSAMVTYVAGVERLCAERHLRCDPSALPEGLRSLLEMARLTAAPEQNPHDRGPSFITRIGLDIVDLVRSTGEIMAFFGEGAIAVRHFLAGRARYRRSEFWVIIQEAGADALPIVSLVSFLVGMILGYIGDQQLAQFGARVYVADLVGLATVIQMGALITGIVLAGRTGAAFAARIGTMQVNEEIDALRTFGIPPMEFLVLPRMLALILMTPLLTLYADLLGILGGAFVGTVAGGLTLTAYLVQTQGAIGWNHIIQGLISGTVYGAIVAASGCLRGLQCGRSAAAVGEATTSAVVTAIVFIVIAAAVLTVIFDAIGLSG